MAETGSVLETLAALGVLVVVIGFFGLIIWLVVRARHKSAKRAQELTGQGFRRVVSADAELEQCVLALRPPSANRPLRLSHIYTRPLLGGTAYLYDAEEGSGDDSGMRREALGVLAPGLNLPHFCLVGMSEELAQARIRQTQVMGSLLQRTVDWALGLSGFERVEYPDDPAFARAFTVLAVDPLAVDACLTLERRLALTALAETENGRGKFSLTARGDFFVLEAGLGGPPAQTASPTISEQLAVANRMLDILR